MNSIDLHDCARTLKYSVAFSVRSTNLADGARARSSIPDLYDTKCSGIPGVTEFKSYEDVLTTGWHSWILESSDGTSPHPSVLYTTELRASAF